MSWKETERCEVSLKAVWLSGIMEIFCNLLYLTQTISFCNTDGNSTNGKFSFKLEKTPHLHLCRAKDKPLVEMFVDALGLHRSKHAEKHLVNSES